ncbi:oxygenase MpaB family protein [Arthrobacter ginkgonis]|uniref:Oxygenase MpaB family protein n=2 Tax=Arthrobacter ginkgonis TaxID=1630594 RepID=A0ABP7CDU1_9MICC
MFPQKSETASGSSGLGSGTRRGMKVREIGDIAAESVTLLGAGRAILLQLAHPAVGHGVARHSVFAQDPMKRLHGTLRYIYSLTAGTPEQAAEVAAHVDAVHARVRGSAAGDGSHPAYDARDPELQLWVAATLHDSAMRVYDAVYPVVPEEAAEEVYRGYAVLGTALQLPEGMWPATRADFSEYWERGVAGLRVDATTRAVAHELLHSRKVSWFLRPAMPLARLVTTGLLPEQLREPFGLPWSPRHERAFQTVLRTVAAVYPRLPRAVRHAPMRYYLRAG